MGLLDKLMSGKPIEPELTLEERLEAILAKATENDTGTQSTDFGSGEEPVIEGYTVEFIEGDVEQITAEWLLSKTEWKLEEGPPVYDPDALVLEPRSTEKLPDRWKDVRRED